MIVVKTRNQHIISCKLHVGELYAVVLSGAGQNKPERDRATILVHDICMNQGRLGKDRNEEMCFYSWTLSGSHFDNIWQRIIKLPLCHKINIRIKSEICLLSRCVCYSEISVFFCSDSNVDNGRGTIRMGVCFLNRSKSLTSKNIFQINCFL